MLSSTCPFYCVCDALASVSRVFAAAREDPSAPILDIDDVAVPSVAPPPTYHDVVDQPSADEELPSYECALDMPVINVSLSPRSDQFAPFRKKNIHDVCSFTK